MANEKRLIAAEAFRNNLEVDRFGYTDIVKVNIALDKSAVDDVEVVHAQWDNNGICTLCGYPIPTDSKHDFIDGDDCLFCYHCGAKMDGGNEDANKD